MFGISVEDRLVGGCCGDEVAGIQPVAGLGEFWIHRRLRLVPARELAGGGRKQRVDPAAQLLGWLRTLEARQRLAARQRHHGRHAFDTEDGADPGHDIDVDRRQRPLAGVGGRQRTQRITQIQAGLAAR